MKESRKRNLRVNLRLVTRIIPHRKMSKTTRIHLARLLFLFVGMTGSGSALADCFPNPSGLIGWWPGDGNANNLLGTNNGTFQGGATATAAGVVGNAFSFDGTNNYVQIPNSPILQPTNLTIEAWIKFSGLDSAGTGPATGVQNIIFKQNTQSSSFEGFDLGKTRVSGSDYFRFIVSSGSGQTATIRSSTIISTGVWYHVAAVRGPNFTQLYVNGVLERQTNVAFAQNYGTQPLYFGTTGQSYWDRRFKGNLDEVSIYNRALGSNEITAIYTSGAAGKCKAPSIAIQPQHATVLFGGSTNFMVTATGIGPLFYQWRLNGTNIVSATNATLALVNLQASNAGIYSVVISNLAGTTISTGAALTVGTPAVLWNVDFGTTTTDKAGAAAVGQHPNDFWNAYPYAGGFNAGGGVVLLQTANTNATSVGINLPGAPGSWGNGSLDPMYQGYVYPTFNPSAATMTITISSLPPGDFDFCLYSSESNFQLVSGVTDYGVKIGFDDTATNPPLWQEGKQYVQFRNVAVTNVAQPVIITVNPGPSGYAIISGLQIVRYAPLVVTPPTNAIVTVGNLIILQTLGEAAGPLNYQWFFNGNPLANDGRVTGATSNTLVITNAQLSDAGNYFAVLSGSSGSITSAVALVQVQLPPDITQSPNSQTNLVGTSVSFSATASGTAPLSYQWFLNGAPLSDTARISGANSNSISIANLQPSDAGNYWVQVSNNAGGATSAVATLTVNPAACFPSDSSLAGWWQAEGNGYDAANANFATLSNGVTFTNGVVGQSFGFDGVNDFILIPPSASLNVGTNSGLTIECWINPTSVAGQQPLVEWNNPLLPKTDGVHFWISVASAGSLYVNLVDSSFADHIFSSPAGIVTPNTFQHVAVTYDKASGIATFYYNGTPVASQNLGVFTPQTAHPLHFGHRPYGSGYFYTGLMDEIGLYHRALTPAELQSLYNSTALGRCPTPPAFLQPLTNLAVAAGNNVILSTSVSGTQPLNYQWYFNNFALTNNLHISGATSDRLTLSAIQTNDGGNYWLVISNAAGISTSTIATVQVGFAPTITLQPASTTNMVGSATTFLTAVTGDEPLSYQWYQNTTALTNDARHSGVTTTNLSITSLVTTDSGNYTLRANNLFGGATSVVAILTVPTPPSITVQPKGYSVPVGMPVTLTATATGASPLRYQWVLNSNPIPNATNFSFTISNLLAGDFGNYQVVVTNLGGAITSAIAPLTVGNIATWGSLSQAASFPLWPTNGLGNVIAVAAGSSYNLALRPDGTVHLWGGNNQVTNIPPGLSGVVGIAAGPSHALALLSNGMVRAWGVGTSGQTNVPATLSNVIAVAAGSAHSAALRADGTVVVWGGSSVEAQTNVPAGLMKVTSIDAGGSQTLALREDGKLIAWGGRIQYPVPPDVKNVTGFSVGPAFGALDLAVTSNGLVRAWGGSGSATNVPATISGISAVEGAGGSDQTTGIALAIRSNRTVIGWGGNVGSVSSLTNVPPGVSNVITLSGGLSHVLALVDNGAPLIIRPPVGGTFYTGRDLVLKAKAVGTAPLAFQWFKNGNPIPGATDESLVLTFALTNDAGSYHLVVSNALGAAQSVAVPVTLVDRAPVLMSQVQSRYAYYGSPFSVGASVIGSGPIDFQWLQNGVPAYNGTNDLVFDRALPQHDGNYQLIVSNPFGAVTSSVAQIKFTRIAVWGNGPSLSNAPVDLGTITDATSAYYHLLAIKPDGTVAAWGTTLNGATNVPPGLSNVVAVTGGRYFSVALRSDGSAVAWGLNNYGQTNVPATATNLSAISAGIDHILGLRSNGTLVAWGYSANGRTNIPEGLSNVVAICAGHAHNVALKSDGSAVSWGLNALNPPYLTNLIAISAGTNISFGLRPDGTVISWTGNSFQPVPANLANVVTLASGGHIPPFSGIIDHSFALLSNGTVVGWGNNFANQLNYPAELTSVTKLSCGYTHTLAVLNDRSPVVATQPFGKHVPSGKNVTLAALAVGQPDLNFQWQLNGNDIPGATSPTLTLTNVNRDSRGYYSALVWNSLGSTTSREAWLDVVGPVRLLTTAGVAGEGLSFMATDSSGGALTAEDLAWLELQASTNLVNWQTVSSALTFTNGSLLLQDPGQSNFPTRFYRLIEQ
jgi:alpha-tubulin suppressor-like RCC1 family protein